MKRLMNRWLAIVLLMGTNAAAQAQQNAQTIQPVAQQNQNGQQQYQPTQLPTGKPSNGQFVINPVINPYAPTNGQFQTFNPHPTAIQNWFSTGPGAVWSTVMDLNTDMSLTPADDALRAHLSLPKDQGLIVTSLAPTAPAAQAGVQQNDVLLKLGDGSLAKAEDLEEGLKAAGEKPIYLTILRGGKRLKMQVQPRVRVTMGAVQPESPAFWIGVSVSPLEPALRSQLKLPQNRGLLAIEVVKDGPAAQAEVKVHDILLSLDGKLLDSQEKLVELVQASGEKSVSLELIREGKSQTILVTPRRRKPSQHQAAGPRAGDLYYQFVRPGAVLNVDPKYQVFPNGAILSVDPNGGWIADVTGESDLKVANGAQHTEPKAAANFTASLKRLDDLDAEIKQLRTAIEELNKILWEQK
jgi:membrane-associated protease RseP (regulator of RpoE activity)